MTDRRIPMPMDDFSAYTGIPAKTLRQWGVQPREANNSVLFPYSGGHVRELILDDDRMVVNSRWALGGGKMLCGVNYLQRKLPEGDNNNSVRAVILVEGESSALSGSWNKPGWAVYVGSSGPDWPDSNDQDGERLSQLLSDHPNIDVYVWPKRQYQGVPDPAAPPGSNGVWQWPVAPPTATASTKWLPSVFRWSQQTDITLKGVICGGLTPSGADCVTVDGWVQRFGNADFLEGLQPSVMLCAGLPGKIYEASMRPGTAASPRAWFQARAGFPSALLASELKNILDNCHSVPF